MAKVIRLFNERESEQTKLIKHIEGLLEMAKKGEIKTLMCAAHMDDGSVITGYCNLNVFEKQFLNSHIQVDINFEITKINADQLIEYIE